MIIEHKKIMKSKYYNYNTLVKSKGKSQQKTGEMLLQFGCTITLMARFNVF